MHAFSESRACRSKASRGCSKCEKRLHRHWSPARSLSSHARVARGGSMYENPWWNPAAVRALAQRSHRGPEGHPVLARQCLLAHHGTPRTAQLRNRSDGDTIPASRAEPNRGAVANRLLEKKEKKILLCAATYPRSSMRMTLLLSLLKAKQFLTRMPWVPANRKRITN